LALQVDHLNVHHKNKRLADIWGKWKFVGGELSLGLKMFSKVRAHIPETMA
jgi:hypothetical protein